MAVRKRVKAKAGKVTAKPRRRPGKSIELREAPAATHASVMRGFRRVLKEHGIRGEMAAFQLDSSPSAVGKSAVGCPSGQVRRMVATRLPNGSLKVDAECVAANPVVA